MKRISTLERLGLRIYTMPGVDRKFLNMRKSFDQVNKLLKEFPGVKPRKK